MSEIENSPAAVAAQVQDQAAPQVEQPPPVVLTQADAEADLAGTARPDNPGATMAEPTTMAKEPEQASAPRKSNVSIDGLTVTRHHPDGDGVSTFTSEESALEYAASVPQEAA